MEHFFISPPDATDLKINPAKLVESLKLQWPNAKIHHVYKPASNRSLVLTTRQQNRKN